MKSALFSVILIGVLIYVVIDQYNNPPALEQDSEYEVEYQNETFNQEENDEHVLDRSSDGQMIYDAMISGEITEDDLTDEGKDLLYQYITDNPGTYEAIDDENDPWYTEEQDTFGSTGSDGYLGKFSRNKYNPDRIDPSDYLDDKYSTEGPKLYNGDGEFRGNLNGNKYDPDSVSNPYGRYGSKYSSESINNPYGAGSKYDSDSPNNQYGDGWDVIEDDSFGFDTDFSIDTDSDFDSDW